MILFQYALVILLIAGLVTTYKKSDASR
jgi:hypothetical protein